MPLRSDEYYRNLVEDQLRAAGCAEPPVVVASVAKHLGVPVLRIGLPPWFSAALIYENGMPAVLLNADRTPEVQDRALAHVLGHLLAALDDPESAYPRGSDPDHRFAELMADEFQTPGYLVRDQARKWFNDYRYLAGLFGVTETRMFERMRDLGLIKARGVIWDY